MTSAHDETEDKSKLDLPPAGGDADAGLSQLRISKVLAELKGEKGSYKKLAEDIREVVEGNGESQTDPELAGISRALDRRKLKSIVDNDPKLVLSLAELRGLDQYLEQFGQGLAVNPLFEKPELLRAIAESRHAAFLLGSKRDRSDDLRINISHWDVLGLSSIQAGIQSYGKNLLLDIREARMHEDVTEARKDLGDPELLELFGERGPSLICLGSSRGNQLAEVMLGIMLGIDSFEDAVPGSHLDLPFHFVWPRTRKYVLPSKFHLYGEDATRESKEAGDAVMNEGAACFRHAGGYLIDELTTEGKREGRTFALCAAQRRENGQIWLLVAGLTGPATYAAARWAHKMATHFDHGTKPGRPSRVYWNLVSAMATPAADARGGTYRVGDAEVVGGGVADGPSRAGS
jgi:hypothetical protein